MAAVGVVCVWLFLWVQRFVSGLGCPAAATPTLAGFLCTKSTNLDFEDSCTGTGKSGTAAWQQCGQGVGVRKGLLCLASMKLHLPPPLSCLFPIQVVLESQRLSGPLNRGQGRVVLQRGSSARVEGFCVLCFWCCCPLGCDA